jgi:hypothetical protein
MDGRTMFEALQNLRQQTDCIHEGRPASMITARIPALLILAVLAALVWIGSLLVDIRWELTAIRTRLAVPRVSQQAAPTNPDLPRVRPLSPHRSL